MNRHLVNVIENRRADCTYRDALAIQVQLHSFLNCSCTADHDGISRIQIYSFKVD